MSKKRGRPSNAEIAARKQAVVTHNGDQHYRPEPKEEPMQKPVLLQPTEVAPVRSAPTAAQAQAYALKVWGGQSVSLGRGERVRRIKAALEGQGMSMEGVKLPGAAEPAAGGDWDEADEQPVTWRRARA